VSELDLAGALRELLPALARPNRAAAAGRSHWRAALDEPLPEEGAGAAPVLGLLRDRFAAAGLGMDDPGFVGWIATGPAVVPTVAGLVASVASPQRWWVGPGNFAELLALRWLGQIVGLDGHPAGALVSGGAVANLVALAAARQRAAERIGLDPAEEGVAALPCPRVYAADTCHQVIDRALAVLGLGRRALVRLPAGRRGATLDPGELGRAIDRDRAAGATPIALVATAGDASTGAIDPLAAMADIAGERDLWLHVDGAYGAFAVLDPRLGDRFAGLARADSIALDPHKWLAVPVGCGAALIRDAGPLERALALGAAPYLEHVRRGDGDPASPFDELGEGRPDHTIEHSAPARGIAVWAALKELGRAGLRARVARHIDCARRVAARCKAEAELELLAEPALSIVCFRYRPPGVRDTAAIERANRAVLAAVRARGRVVPSSTRVGGKLALRACFLGARTGLADADAVIDEVLAAGRALSG